MSEAYNEFLEDLVKAANRERKPGEPMLTICDVRLMHETYLQECIEIYNRLEENGFVVLGLDRIKERTAGYTC
jgi:hypothetical protein